MIWPWFIYKYWYEPWHSPIAKSAAKNDGESKCCYGLAMFFATVFVWPIWIFLKVPYTFATWSYKCCQSCGVVCAAFVAFCFFFTGLFLDFLYTPVAMVCTFVWMLTAAFNSCCGKCAC